MYMYYTALVHMCGCVCVGVCVMCAVPENIDCGCCLAGGEEVVVLQCENKGGEGRFRLCGTDSQGGSQRGEVSLSSV